jgi:hypothetical protein
MKPDKSESKGGICSNRSKIPFDTDVQPPLPENFVKLTRKQVDKKYGSWNKRGGK